MTPRHWSFDRIESWARALAASGLASAEIEEEGFRVRIESTVPAPSVPPAAASGAAARPEAAGSAPPHFSAVRQGRGGASASILGGAIVTAPRVGYFQRATRKENGAARPLHAGDAVDAGEVLGEIVVLSVPYEVKSTMAGRIREILVEDGLGVEYGQPLFVFE